MFDSIKTSSATLTATQIELGAQHNNCVNVPAVSPRPTIRQQCCNVTLQQLSVPGTQLPFFRCGVLHEPTPSRFHPSWHRLHERVKMVLKLVANSDLPDRSAMTTMMAMLVI